jgi:hypothetical protein
MIMRSVAMACGRPRTFSTVSGCLQFVGPLYRWSLAALLREFLFVEDLLAVEVLTQNQKRDPLRRLFWMMRRK